MTTKLTAAEGWAQVFKTIIDECDPQALTEADGYVWRYVANQRKEIERLRAENALVTDQEARTANRCAELQAENAGLHVNLRKFSELVTSITGELDWFRRREPLLQECMNEEYPSRAADAFVQWEKANPKPGAGT